MGAAVSVEGVLGRLAEIKPDLSELYRDLHAHPELSGQEHRTAELIARRLITTVPALLVFEGDRYPALAFPRTDAQRGTIRVEQALKDLVAETAPPVAKAAG